MSLKGKYIRRILRILIYILPLLFSFKLHAEIPIKFTYQGNIREKGILISGQRQMEFALYDSTTSNTPLWTSGVMNVSISTGVFRTILEPNISTDAWNNTLYLEITVQGQKLTPREEITPSILTINTLFHEGKRYYTNILPPPSPSKGDLWFNTNDNILYFYNGSSWIAASGGVPLPHHLSHEPGGSDEITKLSTITFSGDIIMEPNYKITTLGSSVIISTNVKIVGSLDVSTITVSGITAGYFYGNGGGIFGINGNNLIDSSLPFNKLMPCSSNEVLLYDGANWTCKQLSSLGDNLGNHIATKTLNMAGYDIINVSTINFQPNIFLSSSTDANYGQLLYISTNVKVNGNIYATKFYGDGSSLTGISGDNLGNHTATKLLNMANFPVVNVSSMVFSNSALAISSGSAYFGGANTGITVSTNVEVAGQIKAQKFIGDGSGITNINVSGDNLGNHIATTTLNMSNFDIANVSSITVVGNAFSVGISTFVVKEGNIGIGTQSPSSRFEVVGEDTSGRVAIYKAGDKEIGFFRRK